MEFILIALATCLVFWWYFRRANRYFTDRGIPFIKPVPVLGSNWRSLLGVVSPAQEQLVQSRQLESEPFFGIFFFSYPQLVVQDPELIKVIGVKDANHFTDHSTLFIKEDLDPLFAKNLFSLKGKKWKDMRSTLSPAFTSSKMKMMFNLVNACGDQTVQHFENLAKGGKTVEVEMKDVFTRYTNDVIATSAFGIQCNSLADPDNSFYSEAKLTADFKMHRFIFVNLIPGIMKALDEGILPKRVNRFFRGLVNDTLKYREKEGVIRPDMINLLMQARAGNLRHEDGPEKDTGFAVVQESEVDLAKPAATFKLTDDDIAAQAIIFLIAGFDTSSTLLSFTAHELVVNPEVQKRLQDEIDDTLAENNGKITFESLHKMKYLDMVISESLRKHPPAFASDRVCTSDYTLKTSKGDFQIEKGIPIVLPVYAIHHDAKYFPDPEKFDPERFSDDNKHNIVPFSYLPFSIGPRGCIGSRFALMEAKLAIVRLLAKFNLVVTEKTQIPLKYLKSPVKMTAEKGFFMGLESRF